MVKPNFDNENQNIVMHKNFYRFLLLTATHLYIQMSVFQDAR